MRVRCATQRDHVFHPEMNYSQTQLDQLDRLTERRVADHLQKGKTSKESKELVTLEHFRKVEKIVLVQGIERDGQQRLDSWNFGGQWSRLPLAVLEKIGWS